MRPSAADEDTLRTRVREGATLGARSVIGCDLEIGRFAMVGMGAVVAATTRAPLTAILIVYEITQSYETILPLRLAAVISTITAKLIYGESIYTEKLTKMGVRVRSLIAPSRTPTRVSFTV